MRVAFELGAAVALALGIVAIVLFFVRGGFIGETDTSAFSTATEDRVRALADAQHTIARLDAIIESKRSDADDRERAIDQLKAEHEAIARILSVERASIDAIFEEQRASSYRDVWKERGVGLLLGVLSGLLTALVLHWIKVWRARYA